MSIVRIPNSDYTSSSLQHALKEAIGLFLAPQLRLPLILNLIT